MRRISIILPLLLICTALPAQQRLSLKDCLEMGESGNVQIRNSRLDVISAQARKDEAMWAFFPDVSVNALGYHALSPLLKITPKDILGTSDAAWEINRAFTDFASGNGIKTSFSTLESGYGATVMAIQPLYAGGRITNGNRLASIGVEAAGLQSEIKLRDMREEIENKYWLALSLQEKMTTLAKAESVLDSLYRQVLSARKAGLVVEADVSQVSRKRAELASAGIRLRGSLKLAKMDLFNAIGFECAYHELDSCVLSESLSDPDTALIPVYEDCGMAAEAGLLEIREQAAVLEKKVYVGEFLPEVGIGLSYGYGNMTGRDRGLFNGVGFVSVKIPLTGIGKATARAKRYDSEIEKARNEREYLDKQLELQRRQMYLAIETALSQAGLSKQEHKDAEAAVRRCLADYKAGRIPVSELLQAELECRSTAERHIDDCMEYRKAVGAYNRRYHTNITL